MLESAVTAPPARKAAPILLRRWTLSTCSAGVSAMVGGLPQDASEPLEAGLARLGSIISDVLRSLLIVRTDGHEPAQGSRCVSTRP